MGGFIIFIHTMACILLVVVILMQSGRGGGLTEGFASAESMFGAQTNSFLVKSTTVLCVLFFVTCLSMALLSLQKEKSLMTTPAAATRAVQEDTVTPQAMDTAPQEQNPATDQSAETVPPVSENATDQNGAQSTEFNAGDPDQNLP